MKHFETNEQGVTVRYKDNGKGGYEYTVTVDSLITSMDEDTAVKVAEAISELIATAS